jgi:5'-nucleotidase
VSGTPADCVKIALAELLDKTPDLVVSGINLGPNVGINVLYSGTVSAATEAAILGVKQAVALSLNAYKDADFPTAARVAGKLLTRLQEQPLLGQLCLNVNLPNLPENAIKGVRLTRQDTAPLVEHFDCRIDPRERLYYWLAEINNRKDLDPDTDYGALEAGYIAITPLHHDLTHYPSLDGLRGLER